MESSIQEIVWAVEAKIMHKKSFNNHGVTLFRDQGCLRDDFRLERMVEETVGIFISAFIKESGRTNLTKTLVKVGEMIARRFSIKANTSTAIQLGNLIVDQMITLEYLLLTQEQFFTLDEIVIQGKKTTVRTKGYLLEIGPKFVEVEFAEKTRTGIRNEPYNEWKSDTRIIGGVRHELAKYYGDKPKVYGTEPYLKAINNLEKVKWEVNPKVAGISKLLAEDIKDTVIILDLDVEFDVRDIKRENLNKHLKGQKLFLNGLIFEPTKGNSLTVDTLEAEMNRLNRRVNQLAEGGEARKIATKEFKKITRHYEKHSNFWVAKKLCLAKQSKVARDCQILNTIEDWNYGFYLGMYLDFRGRMYAKDPFFNYQSSDLARGHLLFSEKKLMTDKGYQYLLAHTANSFNKSYTINELDSLDWLEIDYKTDLIADGIPSLAVDKMSIKDRISWSKEHLDLFLDVAEDPIATKDIWMNAEKPWVFLSLCFEIVGYLFSEDGYYSQMPIAIDGASNGTQHLAAMSKDEVAGRMVGLVPMDKPIDFYIEVAKGILNRNIGTDLGKLLANIPMKYIRKGITKRGTMTRAYDAGVRCISDIIYTDCYTAGMTVKYGITKNIAFDLARHLVETYNTLCSGPVAVKNYLQALVKHQMKTDDVITWTTPSGFPAVSERWLWRKSSVRVVIQSKQLKLIIRENCGIAAKSEVISGISPNYVHSMDASHMAMVINDMNEEGIVSFGAIHDSFSVHAEDVDRLLEVTKETFIDMYSGDTFEAMAKQITNNDPMLTIVPPKLGKLDLNSIRNSDYFFS